MFRYNTNLGTLQEKYCNLIQKKLRYGAMKMAVNIRMPEKMKKALDRIAESEFRSLNSVILHFLDKQLRAKGIQWQTEESEEDSKK